MPEAPHAALIPSFQPAGHDCDGCCLAAGQTVVYALVPAAGQGTRMGGATNKPFLDLEGVPVIVRTLRTLSACPCIAGMVVMARPEEVPVMQEILAPEFAGRLIGLAAGGETRQASVANGLRLLSAWLEQPAAAQASPLVAIHDGARCLVTREVICRTLRHAAAITPCAAAVPVKDTIKSADPSGRVHQTLDRSCLYAIQTPQVARLADYLMAFARAEASGFVATDDLSVLEAAGMPVDLVPGDEHNIKLTTPWDLMIARALLSAAQPDAQPDRHAGPAGPETRDLA